MKSVLVFDSGVGGLSVFQEIAILLPRQHIVYAFDNEAFPYGELADSVLISRVCRMISAICAKQEIELVVIACNTASTVVLPPLRAQLSIPVVGVVPAIKPAAILSQIKKIGLLATPATIKRAYTQQLIQKFAPNCEVKLLGTVVLVHIAEAKLRGVKTDTKQLEHILNPFIDKVDCVVLGCTHFPLLRAEIENVLGANCTVIDSGKAVALRVQHLLTKQIYLEESDVPLHQVMCSSVAENETELNCYLATLGFSSITRCPEF